MDPLTLTLTAAAMLVPLDLVRSSQSLERARTHDRAILRLLGIATVVLLTVDLVAGTVLSLGVLGYWRERSLRNLLLTAGLAVLWLVAPLLAPMRGWIALGWLLLALLEASVTLWFWGVAKGWWIRMLCPVTLWREGKPPTLAARLFVSLRVAERLPLWPLSGFRGQHTYFAAGLALLLPLAWLMPPRLVLSASPPLVGVAELYVPILGVLWLLMLIGISSWVGVCAGLVGLGVVEPRLTPIIVGGVITVLALLVPRILDDRPSLLDLLPRGDSLDSVKERGRTLWFMLETMGRWSWKTWCMGRGWDGASSDLLRGHLLGRIKGMQGTAHNDVLDVVYTSGVLGIAMLVALGWRLVPALRLGDPWSAVVVVGVVIALGSSALRYPSIGIVWWISAAFVAWRA